MVAIGQEKHEMRITTDREDPIHGKGATTERVGRIDDRDLTRDAINDRGILFSLVPGRCSPTPRRICYW
jgi:hypothetical protein